MYPNHSTRHWLQRRSVLGAGFAAGIGVHQTVQALPDAQMEFPRDAGAHPDFATEWWYVTGYITDDGGAVEFGFQVTFFRSRVPKTQGMQSRLAARQLIFSHAALTDIRGRKLWHDQRSARSSGHEPGPSPTDTASVSTRDTAISLRDWSLARSGADLRVNLLAANFSLALTLVASQTVLLQGAQGLSRKGPDAAQSSYYYSLPQLKVQGEVVLQGKQHRIGAGSTAWLDHEWSQKVMHPLAVGWDWIGINFFDGSALMAFRMREKNGNALWEGGSFRAKEKLLTFQRGDVVFKPLRMWESTLSQANYPVEWLVQTPAGFYTLRAVLDDQEMDSRTSTGAIYWEGLCEVWDGNQRLVGRGYLEMTGYASPMRL